MVAVWFLVRYGATYYRSSVVVTDATMVTAVTVVAIAMAAGGGNSGYGGKCGDRK